MEPTFVLDASFAAHWLFKEEQTRFHSDALLKVSEGAAVVPAHFHLEIANLLLSAERRGRIPPFAWRTILDEMSNLPLEIDTRTWAQAWDGVIELAGATGLVVYDAAYLELAMRRGLALATDDVELRQAAIRRGVDLLRP